MRRFFCYHAARTNQLLYEGIEKIKTYCEENKYEISFLYQDIYKKNDDTRNNIEEIKKEIKKKDVLILASLNCLGSSHNIADFIRFCNEKNFSLVVLDINSTRKIDTNSISLNTRTIIMKTIYDVYESQAEFVDRKSENKKNISEKIGNEAVGYGRPPAVDYIAFETEYEQVLNGKKTSMEVMRNLNMSKSSFYRYKAYYEEYMKEKDK